jgi:RNA polymerase sigma factor (sigma-70 family)
MDGTTPGIDSVVGIVTSHEPAPEDSRAAAGERRRARDLARARTALAEALLGHPQAVAFAVRVLETWLHRGHGVRRAWLVDLPLPDDIDAVIRALHDEVGCQRRSRSTSLDVPLTVTVALGRLPWSGAWQIAVLDGLDDAAVADDVRRLAARWVAERNAVVETHVGLVRHVVQRHRWAAGPRREDLIQEAHLALCRAVERFDPDRGARFSSYAVPVIRHALAEYIRRMGSGWAVPRLSLPMIAEGSPPRSGAMGGRGTGRSSGLLSLDAPLDDGGSLAERLTDTEGLGPDLAAVRVLERERLRDALRTLPIETEAIVSLHWGLDGSAARSVHAVARQVGRTPAEVAAVVRDALRTLRSLITTGPRGDRAAADQGTGCVAADPRPSALTESPAPLSARVPGRGELMRNGVTGRACAPLPQ